jgi:prepilin-type N-terminal cleavage/methylation domain-containing protein
MRRQADRGFTLMELLIVMAVLAIIAALSIPNLLASKVNANQTAALATMRNLVSAQAQIGVTAKIDADNDGKGEYGTFLEMSGAVGVRKGFVPGTPSSSNFSVKGEVLNPPVLSSAFANLTATGFCTRSGYCFMILLPDTSTPASFVHETGGPGVAPGFAGGSGSVGVDASETTWCAYAQPQTLGATGSRRFFTNQKGDILASPNDFAKSQGNMVPVAGNAAFLGSGITSTIAIGTKGSDGDLWTVAQ